MRTQRDEVTYGAVGFRLRGAIGLEISLDSLGTTVYDLLWLICWGRGGFSDSAGVADPEVVSGASGSFLEFSRANVAIRS